MSDIDPEELEAYAERTGIPLTAPTAEPTPPAEVVVVGEPITLDLGSGAAAWDDSELVNAWDAAAEEFKVRHSAIRFVSRADLCVSCITLVLVLGWTRSPPPKPSANPSPAQHTAHPSTSPTLLANSSLTAY